MGANDESDEEDNQGVTDKEPLPQTLTAVLPLRLQAFLDTKAGSVARALTLSLFEVTHIPFISDQVLLAFPVFNKDCAPDSHNKHEIEVVLVVQRSQV